MKNNKYILIWFLKMAKNGGIFDYCSYERVQNHLLSEKNDRKINNEKYINNNYNSFNNAITNYKITVNNPLFKENNFFLKTNDSKKAKLFEKTKKQKSHCNKLIINTNPNCNYTSINNNKTNKQNATNRLINYYSNIYINNDKYNNPKIIKDINKLISPRLKTFLSKQNINNNSFIFISPYQNNNNGNNKNNNRIKTNYPIKINKDDNKKTLNKFSSSPYLNINLKDNRNINEYKNTNKYNNKYERKNNVVNFNNENINYNNIKNIQNNEESTIKHKTINYNKDKNYKYINYKKTNNIKTKIKINVYPNYLNNKINNKFLHINQTQKNLTKINNDSCLKCKNQQINTYNNKNYNKKEPFLDNYAFLEIKNTHAAKCYNNYNSNKSTNNLNNKTDPNILVNSKKESKNKQLNNKSIISLVKKNYECFLKNNNQFNPYKISNNNKKKKRAKSKNQIEIEKNLDKQKALTFRESMSLKPFNSSEEIRNKVINNIQRTLSQKKYKEDDKNIFNKEVMNNLKSTLFEKNNKYNNNNLQKQIGCKFSIYKKDDKNINECLNEVITYFNSENLRKKKNYY